MKPACATKVSLVTQSVNNERPVSVTTTQSVVLPTSVLLSVTIMLLLIIIVIIININTVMN